MDELQIYGKDGLFHNVVKQSEVFSGRYGVLPKGGQDLNLNNILTGIEFPEATYPGVFCVPPLSELQSTVQQGAWECFYFRLFFLCTTHYTGDNKIKSPDPSTNTSLHTIPMDWSDMKGLALSFMNALEIIQKSLRAQFRLRQSGKWKIVRLSGIQNAKLSGVMLQFEVELATSCEFTDININQISIVPPSHYH